MMGVTDVICVCDIIFCVLVLPL